MENRCTKYETLFTFADEETLKEHLATCEDCQHVQKEMDRVSELIDEVKPFYRKKRDSRSGLRVACILFALVFGGASLGVVGTNQDVMDYLMYGETLSAEDLGFPVDSYGLLLVE